MEGRKLDEQRKMEFKEIEESHMRDKSVSDKEKNNLEKILITRKSRTIDFI